MRDPDIKLTIAVKKSKVLNTEIMIKFGIIEASTVVKESKISNHWLLAVSHWLLAVLKMFIRNVVLGHLNRVHKILKLAI